MTCRHFIGDAVNEYCRAHELSLFAILYYLPRYGQTLLSVTRDEFCADRMLQRRMSDRHCRLMMRCDIYAEKASTKLISGIAHKLCWHDDGGASA